MTLLESLEQEKDQIEFEVGESLVWDPMEYRACRIAVIRPGSIDDREETLTEIRQWMVQNLIKIRDVFGPRLAELARQIPAQEQATIE